ncbi:Dodecanoyl-[acyl-carrier-protein] hydrolase [Paenibacillus nuruki]|uniref:Dodecanoyl-[acyl-carrier-protein] hydrolase n=1 Tax=Paenibacillus nuruki TaxID=1886670 RepID=A0A1E3L8J5_9BACL|nr:thioesterase domain-containing protein [Paenibacillus nuruki]ODP30119.1 Dodecanoyl-[acyl-carrier-protein] hydrolase [Paenibacillus nuruki]
MGFIMEENYSKSNSWFIREPSAFAKARLFCIPYSGCGASMYRHWPEFIGKIEICPIQLPGRENRFDEPTYTSYEQLAKDLNEAIQPYLDRPFAFFGHCGSALPSYEASLQLMKKGGPMPSHLFISSQVAPHEGPYGRFLELDDYELAVEIELLTYKMGGVPIPDMIELNKGIMRADLESNRHYIKQKPEKLDFPVTVIGWKEDKEVDPDLLVGWSSYGSVSFKTLTGDHHHFLHAPMELMTIIAQEMRYHM